MKKTLEQKLFLISCCGHCVTFVAITACLIIKAIYNDFNDVCIGLLIVALFATSETTYATGYRKGMEYQKVRSEK